MRFTAGQEHSARLPRRRSWSTTSPRQDTIDSGSHPPSREAAPLQRRRPQPNDVPTARDPSWPLAGVTGIDAHRTFLRLGLGGCPGKCAGVVCGRQLPCRLLGPVEEGAVGASWPRDYAGKLKGQAAAVILGIEGRDKTTLPRV